MLPTNNIFPFTDLKVISDGKNTDKNNKEANPKLLTEVTFSDLNLLPRGSGVSPVHTRRIKLKREVDCFS